MANEACSCPDEFLDSRTVGNSSEAPLVFLVVDHHNDGRFLLVKCLLRKFPNAIVQEAQDGDSAIEMARRGGISAIVTHRTREYIGVELVGKLRAANADVPIVMVSGIERTAPALAAGADRFLLYDEWLRIGTVVKELINAERPASVVHLKVPLPEDT